MGKSTRVTSSFQEKIRRDVGLVESRADAVVEIIGDKIEVTYNQNSTLGIIAIIGPGKARGYHFSKAVLEEIGIGWSRPYHQARIPQKMVMDGESPNITYRLKDFSLTAAQYQLVVPLVFSILQKLADQNGNSRKCGPDNSYCVGSPRAHYSQKARKLAEWGRLVPVLGERRFAVSLNSRFAADIFWAELNANVFLRRFLSKLANFTDLYLKRCKEGWKGKKKFADLTRVKKIASIIQRKGLSFYLLAELIELLPAGRKNFFYQDLFELFGWGGEQTPERELSCLALPDPMSRVGETQIRVRTGLDAGKDHIVFAVLYSAYLQQLKCPMSLPAVSEEESLLAVGELPF